MCFLLWLLRTLLLLQALLSFSLSGGAPPNPHPNPHTNPNQASLSLAAHLGLLEPECFGRGLQACRAAGLDGGAAGDAQSTASLSVISSASVVAGSGCLGASIAARTTYADAPRSKLARGG